MVDDSDVDIVMDIIDDIVKQIEAACGKPGYKTNLVKCPPIDKNGKLRYPNRTEIDRYQFFS